jgi:hypothetical protein
MERVDKKMIKYFVIAVLAIALISEAVTILDIQRENRQMNTLLRCVYLELQIVRHEYSQCIDGIQGVDVGNNHRWTCEDE